MGRRPGVGFFQTDFFNRLSFLFCSVERAANACAFSGSRAVNISLPSERKRPTAAAGIDAWPEKKPR